MVVLKPWYTVVRPREDLRQGKPLDAAEFAVHLDHVRDGRAPEYYQDPEKFFDRTYLTKNLCEFAAEVVRRLSGEQTQTSAVFNMATQFGGGKTHALTLLYHLATRGSEIDQLPGVPAILEKADISSIPKAATAVFVGTEFDTITGRGGTDGTPLRRTPWGEIAYQLGGEESFNKVKRHDEEMTAPGGDVISAMLPKGVPCLILMDEVMNYVNRFRKTDKSNQFYSFLQNLSEAARAEHMVVLVVSIPASEMEMTSEDHGDYDRFKKLLNRLGKQVIMSTPSESTEIIRRRLFEWDGIPEDGRKTITEYSRWVMDHRDQLSGEFSVDNAGEAFRATYPFHPAVISVFERKWRTLPKFQQTRGILRLLALWISINFKKGNEGEYKDALIDLGSAPLENTMFRTAVFEQLGEDRLEAAVTNDIAGKKESCAIRLDNDSKDAIGKSHLHQKVSTSIFFESNGGQLASEGKKLASLPEIRFAVGKPGLDIGNIETVIDELAPPHGACYYLDTLNNKYWYGVNPNLTKMHADRMATLSSTQQKMIEETVLAEIQKEFQKKADIRPIFFPNKSNDVADRPELTLVVFSPDNPRNDQKSCDFLRTLFKENGNSSRTFKSALIVVMAESQTLLDEKAKNILAWDEIADDPTLNLDDTQKIQAKNNRTSAERDLKEAVWRTYKYILLLGKNNAIQEINMGMSNSSSATSLVTLILDRLKRDDILTLSVKPGRIVKNWPPAMTRWNTKSVRDAFFSSPLFPRVLNDEVIKETIARGVSEGLIGYASEQIPGKIDPFVFNESINSADIEISDDVFIVTSEEAQRMKVPSILSSIELSVDSTNVKPGEKIQVTAIGRDQYGQMISLENVEWDAKGGSIDNFGNFVAGVHETEALVTVKSKGISTTVPLKVTIAPVITKKAEKMEWSGEVQPQKWMNFYTKVLGRFATKKGLKIKINIEVSEKEGINESMIEDTKAALRELGLNEEITLKKDTNYFENEE
jgi:hypothetical protein